MDDSGEIFELIGKQENHAARSSRQALIIQPGAIGDCILTLPLANYLKTVFELGSITMLSHTEYTSFFPGRTDVNSIRSLESAKIHRLFAPSGQMVIEDKDPLLGVFLPYNWIVSFLGTPGSDFERNLIFTVNCTHSADLAVLNLKPQPAQPSHVSLWYIDQLVKDFWPAPTPAVTNLEQVFITPTHSDRMLGLDLLGQYDIYSPRQLIIIAPGSGGREKCWPIENFLAVARALQVHGYEVLFLIGPAEQERYSQDVMGSLNLIAPVASNLSLSQVLGLLSISQGFIGNDSGITHLAGAIGTRTVAVFGPTSCVHYRPLGPVVIPIQMQPDEFTAVSQYQHDRILNAMLEL